ncbi:MAG: ion transporter [Deltaproteobacteria bacterium]|nr:ion transporter [Deltaproteobacteria bacterium]
MPQNFRETLQFYLIDCKTPLGKLIDVFIILLNLFICAILVIETYPVSPETREWLWRAEVVIVFFFILEYCARLYGARNRLKQLLDIYSIIDLIAILPTLSLLILPFFGITFNIGFIKLIRIFRVFRIFRFLRFTADPDFFFGSIPGQLLNVVRLCITIFMIFFISSGLFFLVENGVNAKVNDFGDAFYFTVVALTTVGFGDITPLSGAGKWVVRMGSKKEVICPGCGLRYHDVDASHCKSCGHIIYQEYDGD